MNGYKYILAGILVCFNISGLSAEDMFELDRTRSMQIDGILSMENSATHLYVLSESEGMIVFRTNTDTLQWLYNSENMHMRGVHITPDTRFSYLHDGNGRITVLEPTSLLGVFSSTQLFMPPLSVNRAGLFLYLAMGSDGLYRLSLESPASFDSAPEKMEIPGVDLRNVRYLHPFSSEFLVLTDQQLHFFDYKDNTFQLIRSVRISQNVSRLYTFGGILYGSNDAGDFFEIRSNGSVRKAFSIGEKVNKASSWKSSIVVRGNSGRVYMISETDGSSVSLFRKNPAAGNHFAIVNDELWMNEYELFGPVIPDSLREISSSVQEADPMPLKLGRIRDHIIPLPRQLIASVRVQSNYPAEKVRFHYDGPLDDVIVKGNGIYWTPRVSHTGVHIFSIIGVGEDGQRDTTTFNAEVRGFNMPPRFNPVRPITISVDETFILPFKATDSDGTDQDLIRYLGTDLPETSTISEQTGIFTWRPDRRQVGIHRFTVIATDQFGAATSQEIVITVRQFEED